MQRYFGVVQDQTGRPIQGASVAVYSAGTVTPLIAIYSANGNRVAPANQTNPMTTDANGEFSFAASDGLYDIKITGGSIASKTIPNVILFDDLTTAPSPALGTVTSVGLTLPSFMAVTGSPVTGAGTLAVTMNSQSANLHLASPDGSAGVPSFRALVTGDLPAYGPGVASYGSATQTPVFTVDAKGRVNTVTPTTVTPAFASLTAKPTTLAGYGITDGASLGVAQQFTKAQNVTRVVLTYAATVNTDASLSNVFYLAPTGNFILANPTNLGSGAAYVWIIKQDAAGSRIVTFGNKFKFAGGTAPILSTAGLSIDRLVAVYDVDNDTLMCSLDKAFA